MAGEARRAAERDTYWYKVATASWAVLGLLMGLDGLLSEIKEDSIAASAMIFLGSFMAGLGIASFSESVKDDVAAIRSIAQQDLK